MTSRKQAKGGSEGRGPQVREEGGLSHPALDGGRGLVVGRIDGESDGEVWLMNDGGGARRGAAGEHQVDTSGGGSPCTVDELGGGGCASVRVVSRVLQQNGHPLEGHGVGDSNVGAAAEGTAVMRRGKAGKSVLSTSHHTSRGQRREVAEVQAGRLGVAHAVLPRMNVLGGGDSHQRTTISVHL